MAPGGILVHLAAGRLCQQGEVGAALAAADEALALAATEDLRDLRMQGLRIREQALRQNISQK